MNNKFKPILSLAIILAVAASFVACANKTDTPQTDAGSATVSSATAVVSTAEDSSEDETLSKFEQFEKGMTDKNIKFEVVPKDGSMLGAKEGYGYKFSDNASAELYLFDKSSDAYKKAFKSKKVTLEFLGISMDVDFNDDICIYYDGDIENKSDIQAIFKALK